MKTKLVIVGRMRLESLQEVPQLSCAIYAEDVSELEQIEAQELQNASTLILCNLLSQLNESTKLKLQHLLPSLQDVILISNDGSPRIWTTDDR
ncbi:hypothetical protein Ciccas_007088, partial [Cichlidogyrus casuarinus]